MGLVSEDKLYCFQQKEHIFSHSLFYLQGRRKLDPLSGWFHWNCLLYFTVVGNSWFRFVSISSHGGSDSSFTGAEWNAVLVAPCLPCTAWRLPF